MLRLKRPSHPWAVVALRPPERVCRVTHCFENALARATVPLRHRSFSTMAGLALLACVTGCGTTGKRIALDPIPLARACDIVNRNIARIGGTLRASGSVDGYFTTSSGQRRSYHLDGVLFYLAPDYMRFDLKSFGRTQILFGSNKQYYWVYDKQEDAYHCGRHGVFDQHVAALPARPDQIIDALGLSNIPLVSETVDLQGVIQRVVSDYQQVLFVIEGDDGNVVLEKEYWLDRYAPQLVRRVVFRNGDGVVEMESRLDRYKRIDPDGPWLAHAMTAEWPGAGAGMTFTVRKWSPVYQVQRDSIQFATPDRCP